MAKKISLHDIYNIPKSFEVAGQMFNVRIGRDIETEGAVGLTKFMQHEVRIRTHFNGEEMAPDHLRVTFWHEVLHCIAMTLNEGDFNENEKLIDTIAHFIHQVEKTSAF